MKPFTPTLLAALASALAITTAILALTLPRRPPSAGLPDHPPPIEGIAAQVGPLYPSVLPPETRSVRLRGYLYSLADRLADAYADRSEDFWSRRLRLKHFADEITGALETDWRMLPDRDWKYGATLVWLAHRETRIARNPRLLGNEDEGRAHGPLQVWAWHGQDPFAASTWLDMLLEAPGSSWSLPKGEPWLGYPACAAFVREHPFDD